MRLLVLAAAGLVACDSPKPETPATLGRASLDSALTIFDSLSAIPFVPPDTALLRSVRPSADTIQSVEGTASEAFTGDSLFKRVRALYVPVHKMAQRFTDRVGHFLGAKHAVLTANEKVEWT